MGEAPIEGELSARLNMVLAAIDDLTALPKMAGDREHLWTKRSG